MGTPIASTRVWHEGKAYDVSTIDRESSAAAAYGDVYAETIVWEVGPDGKRNQQVFQDEAIQGSIAVHQNIVSTIRDYGIARITDDAT